jgi:hypothetical protein
MAADGKTSAGEATEAERPVPRRLVRGLYYFSIVLLVCTVVVWVIGDHSDSAIRVIPGFCFAGDRYDGGSRLKFYDDVSSLPTSPSTLGPEPMLFIRFDRYGFWLCVRTAFPNGGATMRHWFLIVSPLWFLALSAIGPMATLPSRLYRRAGSPRLAVLYWVVLAYASAFFLMMPEGDERWVLSPLAGVIALAGLVGFAWLVLTFLPKKRVPAEKAAEDE